MDCLGRNMHWLTRHGLLLRPWAPWAVFSVVVFGSAAVATTIYRIEDAHHEAHFALAAATAVNLIEAGAHVRFRPVQHLAAVFDFEDGSVSETAFQLLARSIPLTEEPALLALQWIPLRTAGSGSPILAVKYNYGRGAAAIDERGRNLWTDPFQRQALVQAQQQAGLSVSPWYREGDQIRLRASRSIYREVDGQRQLVGFASGVYRVRELLTASLCSLSNGLIDLYVTDPASEVPSQFHCSGSRVRRIEAEVVPEPGQRRLLSAIDIDGHQWRVLAVAKPRSFDASAWIPLAGLGGIAFGGLLAAFHLSLLNRESQVREQVRERTEELQRRTDELRRRTEQLEAMNAELEEFAYVASHDLKAPLRAVSQLASWIDEDMASHLDPETRGRLKLMRERVVRMDGLIDSLLAYSRAGRVTDRSRRPVALESELKSVIDELDLPPGFRVEMGPLPEIPAEVPHVRQIFQNLIANAAAHHDHPVAGTVRIRAEEEGRFWRLEVADDGPGIPPEEREHVFRMFTSLKPDKNHVGIGLAVVRKLIRSYGGQIDVTANVPRGALFRIWWPK